MAEVKLNASLFDKLTINDRIVSIVDDGRAAVQLEGGTQVQVRSADQLGRFNEAAMRDSVRRELTWLLNTVNLEATVDLARYPQVRTSVLNFGMPDLAGRVSTPAAIKARASEIAVVIGAFEPRLDREALQIEPRVDIDADNSVNFLITGDITSALKVMPVRFFASVEMDTGETKLRE